MQAFHLPGSGALSTAPHRFGEAELEVAVLSPTGVSQEMEALRAAGEAVLAEQPVRETVRAIDRVAARLTDPGDTLHRTALELLPSCTGYSPAMAAHVVDRMAEGWREPALLELLRADLGDAVALEGFVEREGRRSRAFGHGVAFHLFSGNVPGVAVTSLVRSLLARTPVLGKAASGEPVLPVLFARGLADEDADLGRCLAVTWWAGGSRPLERAALGAADLAVAYGGEESIAEVRRLAADAGTPLLVYGPRISFGVVARERAGRATAEQAALALAAFDQQGCVSPHLFYVERGGECTPETWSALLAEALAELARDLPPGVLTREERVAVRQAREEAEFAELAGGGTAVWSAQGDEGTGTVIFDPAPAFQASCLNRVVRVKAVDDLAAVPDLVRPYGPVLQTVGIAAPAARLEGLAAALGRLGASRITPLDRMPWPPAGWHHDGRPPLGDLVRWCDLES
jgi:acyl-CoA reductase-like NAD-dependent aldehyde dehydrogenase